MPSRLPWIIAAAAVALACAVLIYSCSETSRRKQYAGERPTAGSREPQPSGQGVQSHPPAAAEGVAPASATPPQDSAGPAPVPRPVATPTVDGTALSGDVTDFEGRPISGALIRMVYEESGRPHTAETRTDAQGRFAANGLPARELEKLIVEAAGFENAQLSSVPLPSTDVAISLKSVAPFLLHADAVSSDGVTRAPFVGEAGVFIMRRSAETPPADVQTVSQPNVGPGQFVTTAHWRATFRDGSCTFASPAPGIYRIGVLAGNEYAETQPLKVEASSRAEAAVVLGLRQSVSGVVKAQGTEETIGGASVIFRQSSRPVVAGPPAELRGRTGPDGTFSVGSIPPGSYLLTLSADGYATKTIEQISVAASPQAVAEPPQIYHLSKVPASVAVLVTDSEEKPVAGAPLVLFATGGTAGKSYFGKTDSAGVFRFASVAPGRYVLAVTAPDSRSRQKRVDIVVAESETKQLQVRLAPPVRVSGTASSGGKPFEGLLVFTPRAGLTQEFAKCDAAGLFNADLESGEYIATRQGSPGNKLVVIPPGPTATVYLDFR